MLRQAYRHPLLPRASRKGFQEPVPKVDWRDLLDLSPWGTAKELILPLPWLAASVWLYSTNLWWLGSLASFMFFLCGLRLNHEAIHGNLGLARKADYWVMHVLSGLMIGSNNAEAFCHLQHHKHSGGPQDHEGKYGHMPWYEVLLKGPLFPVDVFRGTWKAGGPKWRRRMLVDAGFIVAVLVVALILNERALYFHIAAMFTAQCLSAFFAVWLTHHGADGLAGRSQRGPLARLAYLMFYHREHHLFPKVPVSHLPRLAERLDRDRCYARSRKPVIPLLDIRWPQ